MLKWAVTPRLNDDFFEHDGILTSDSYELLTLQSINEQHHLPCLVRLMNDDRNDSIDNYCLLLCQTDDPYLIVSNETERFSIPISFDGLFAPVERGVTRYNILQSVRSLQSHLKSHSTSSDFTHFTTLQPCMTYNNSALRHIRPGTIVEPCRIPIKASPSPSPSSPLITSNRLRTLFANFPHSLNKHLLPNYQQSRLMKNQLSTNEYLEVKSNQYDGNFCLRSDSMGIFVPVHTQLPLKNVHYRSSHLSNQIQGLYTVDFLSKLIDQYPLITELIISHTLEENVPVNVGYPFRRLTVHRFVPKHSRIIAFDMKNYTFIEIDTTNSIDTYAIEHDDTLFQRYQAQLRWCQKHLLSFRSQIKTIVHSSNGTPMFIQATPLHGQQAEQYYQRRNSSSATTSPLVKHIPHTIFTSQESISSSRSRIHTPVLSKYHTTSNRSKYEQKQSQHNVKTIGSSGMKRKDVRFYFDDPTIQIKSKSKHVSFQQKYSNYRTNSTESDSTDGEEETENSFQCTAL